MLLLLSSLLLASFGRKTCVTILSFGSNVYRKVTGICSCTFTASCSHVATIAVWAECKNPKGTATTFWFWGRKQIINGRNMQEESFKILQSWSQKTKASYKLFIINCYTILFTFHIWRMQGTLTVDIALHAKDQTWGGVNKNGSVDKCPPIMETLKYITLFYI